MLTFHVATTDDADDLAPRLRAADVRELAAVTDTSPRAILREAVSLPGLHFVARWNGRADAMFGAATLLPDLHGSAWLLASNGIYQWRRTFVEAARWWVSTFHENYPVLSAWVDARNTVSERWLRAMGFTAQTTEARGTRGEDFTLYVSTRT